MYNTNPNGTGETTPDSYGGAGLIGALVQTGGMLYDSYQNRKASKENTDKTIRANKDQAELAYQRSIQEWNRQNMYNSPEAQMARFKDAGLNPNLIYGQGNAGNSSSPPQYQAPNLQYRYEAPQYGAAFASILPMLMSVGTWMQNMRASEVQIQKGSTDTERSRQLIEFLRHRNPKELTKLDNALSLYPYQHSMQRTAADAAQTKLFELEQEFRYKFGEDLFGQMGSAFTQEKKDIGGLKRLQFLQEQSKTKLLDAKSSWSDFNITDPQHLIQMVLSGVMGLAGSTLRLSTHKRPKAVHEVEESRPGGRTHIRRRTYYPKG